MKKMERKAITAMIMLTFLALTFASAQATSATTSKYSQIITVKVWGVPGPHPDHSSELVYWKGDIYLYSGESIGTCYFWETARNYVVGKNEHFFEDFYIDLGDGWVSGYDNGVWNFATFKYRASGRVTAASMNYEYLIGCKFSEQGVTTNPFDAEGNIVVDPPIVGIGTCFIGP